MSAVWNGDTGHITITVTKDGAAVNLTGATLTIITRNSETAAVTTLSEVSASSNLAQGIVVANAGPLNIGTYIVAVRAVAGGITATYPSADQQDETIWVRKDLDAA